jgi:hypothetical protein
MAEISYSSFLEASAPLVIYMFGIIVYSIFVFKFYKWLARRDALGLHLHKRHGYESSLSLFFKYSLYALENLILIPLFVLLWSGILTAFLAVLSKGLSLEQIMLSSIALVACTRIAAYYSENLAEDLGKMIPFTLLAIYLFDTTFISFESSWTMIKAMPDMWLTGLYYLIFVVVLELVMRISYAFAAKEEPAPAL